MPLKKDNEFEMVCIEWVDSMVSTSGWEFWDDLDEFECAKCRTVGFLVEDTEEIKTVIGTISQNQILGRISIPTKAITSMTKLKKVKEKAG